LEKEILIIRLSSIGDVLHCTPVARSLKLNWPGCRITWLVSAASADVIRYNPDIDACLVWSRERFEACLRARDFSGAIALWRELKDLFSEKSFYAVLDIHGLFLTGVIARQVKSERRIGMKGTKELNSWFMTETAAPLGGHKIDRYLGVLRKLGIERFDKSMVLVIPEAARKNANNLISAAGRLAVLIPGTTWPAKNWPTVYFAAVAVLLAADFTVVLAGGNAEKEIGDSIVSQVNVPILNLIGRTSLLELAAVLERANVVVTGDTGPLYMAVTLGTPVVAMFGPTHPAVYGPRQGEYAILEAGLPCSYCHKLRCPQGDNQCMKKVKPEEVAAAVYRLTGIKERKEQDGVVGDFRKRIPRPLS